MTRRIVLGDFKYRVTNTDTSLMSKLRMSAPALLHKINMAYHAAVQAVGSSSIWEFLPEYFMESQKKFSKAINPLKEFLEINVGDTMEMGPDKFMPYGDFGTMYSQFLRSRGHKNQAFNEDHYRCVFQEYGLTVTEKDSRMYRGSMKQVSWIQGITSKDDDEFVPDS
jgi:hypothetical protein